MSLPRTADVVVSIVGDLGDHHGGLLAALRLFAQDPSDQHHAAVEQFRVRAALLNRAIFDAAGPLPELPEEEGDA